MTSEELLAKIVKEEMTLIIPAWTREGEAHRVKIFMYPDEEWAIITYDGTGGRVSSLSGNPDTIYTQMKRLGILEE